MRIAGLGAAGIELIIFLCCTSFIPARTSNFNGSV